MTVNLCTENCGETELLLFEDSQLKTRRFVLFDEILPLRIINYKNTYKSPKLVISINNVILYNNSVELIKDLKDEKAGEIVLISGLADIFQDYIYKNSNVMSQGRNNSITITVQYEMSDLSLEENITPNNASDEIIPNETSESVVSVSTAEKELSESPSKSAINLMSFEPISPFLDTSAQSSNNNTTNNTSYDTNGLRSGSDDNSHQEKGNENTVCIKKNTAKIKSLSKTLPIYSLLVFKLKNIEMTRQQKIISSLEIQPSKSLDYLNFAYGDTTKKSQIHLKLEDISYFLINDSPEKLTPMGCQDSKVGKNVVLRPENIYHVNYAFPYDPPNLAKICIRYTVDYGSKNGNDLIKVNMVYKTRVNPDKSGQTTMADNPLKSRVMSSNYNVKSLGYSFATKSTSSLLLPPAHTLLHNIEHNHIHNVNGNNSSNKLHAVYNMKKQQQQFSVSHVQDEASTDNTVYAKAGVPFKVKFSISADIKNNNNTNNISTSQYQHQQQQLQKSEVVIYQSINIPKRSKKNGLPSSSRTSNAASDFSTAFNSGATSPVKMSDLYSSGIKSTNSVSAMINQDIVLSNSYYNWKKSLALLPYQNGIVLINNDYKITVDTLARSTMEFQIELVGLQKGYYPNVHGLRIVNLSTGDISSFGKKLSVMVT